MYMPGPSLTARKVSSGVPDPGERRLMIQRMMFS
jgi:hypothetical protein